MPHLDIRTNVALDPGRRSAVLGRASALVAELLGKPEQYVMVALRDAEPMRFAGSPDPLAWLELRSIGLRSETTRDLARRLCEFASAELEVPGERVYVQFVDVPRPMWGWNGDTFG